MAGSIQEQIVEVFDKWGIDLVTDMRASIDSQVKHGGGQESDLSGSVNYKVLNQGGVITFSLSMNKYWKWFDKGRDKGLKGPPIDVFGEQWQNKKGINAKKILGMKIYDKAVKSLAFLIQRSIKRNGIEPRPFYDKVVTEERIQDLKNKLAPIIKKQYILDLTNGINNTK
jgi:hypothetical protein